MPLQGVRVVNSDNMTILGFGDGWKSQITYAKPILDKYRFKASFFVVCSYVGIINLLLYILLVMGLTKYEPFDYHRSWIVFE
jgi:hypothetical protein